VVDQKFGWSMIRIRWRDKGILVAILISFSMYPVGCWAQKQAGTGSANGVQEFPVVFKNSVSSGKTPSGTKVQARLAIATLVNGTVLPQGATFSGEVVVSKAKTKNEPSRLSVRMDLVSWKNESRPIRVFLSEWFYNIAGNLGQGSQSAPVLFNDSVYPAPVVQNTAIYPHRERMKDVDIERSSNGSVTLVCKHCTIKIDRSTTYGLTISDLATSVR